MPQQGAGGGVDALRQYMTQRMGSRQKISAPPVQAPPQQDDGGSAFSARIGELAGQWMASKFANPSPQPSVAPAAPMQLQQPQNPFAQQVMAPQLAPQPMLQQPQVGGMLGGGQVPGMDPTQLQPPSYQQMLAGMGVGQGFPTMGAGMGQ